MTSLWKTIKMYKTKHKQIIAWNTRSYITWADISEQKLQQQIHLDYNPINNNVNIKNLTMKLSAELE